MRQNKRKRRRDEKGKRLNKTENTKRNVSRRQGKEEDLLEALVVSGEKEVKRDITGCL
jgi:hypothetical protein